MDIDEKLKQARLAGVITMEEEAAIGVAVKYLAAATDEELKKRITERRFSAVDWAVEAAKHLCVE